MTDTASERVVVFRTDKIGDLIVSSPLFRAIKEKAPDAFVTLVCSPYNRPVMEGCPDIDHILVYDAADWRARLRFALALRRLRPTVVFVLSPASSGHWLAFLSGAAQRVAMISSYRRMDRFLAPLLLTGVEIVDRAALNRRPDPSRHQSDVTLRLAARCGFPRPAAPRQCVPVTEDARAWVAAQGSAPWLLLHLGATWAACGLDPEAVARLTTRLYETFPGLRLVLTAGPADGANLEIATRRIGTSFPRAQLFSHLAFTRWSALIAGAVAVVTPDTGAVHLASAHRRPVVAVYVPDRYNAMTSMFGPWQTPFRTVRGGKPETELTEEIVTSLRALLGE